MNERASENMPAAGRRRLALGLYALTTPLAFPHELPWGGVFDGGLAATWLVPMFLVLGLEGRSFWEAARAAFGASLIGHAVLFHWFFVVTVVYGGMPAALGMAAPLVPALYVSLFSALFAMGWVRLAGAGRGGVVSGAALWVTLDWARAHFLGGFPWATLGYGLHLDLPLLGLTRWTGVYGLSFLAVAAGIVLARNVSHPGGSSRRQLGMICVGLLLAHGLGAVLQAWGTVAREGAPRIRVAAIQGNVDQGEKWDEARRRSILEKYRDRSLVAARAGADWIVWPETAVPGLVEHDPLLSDQLRGFARSEDVVLVVGGMGAELDPTGQRIGAFFDSAFVFDRRGEMVDRYDKTHLVPFGEFVPFRALLGRVFEALATGLSSSDVTAGGRPRVIERISEPPGAPAAGHFQMAVPICYELLFPHVMRRFAADGADVMLAITNDAWYGRTGAPHQFLAMTAMRAAENGLWLVRSANTGISAIIDDRGRVREHSGLFEDATVAGDVPISTGGPRTMYARLGDVFAGLCILWTLFQLGLRRSQSG